MLAPFATKASVALLAILVTTMGDANECAPANGVALQVLGSGGPIADDARASSGYIVWVDGESRILIDAGGGSLLRFAEAQADFNELDFVGLSHFHADHSADFPALLKSGSFSKRTRALIVTGPDGNSSFPGLKLFLENLLTSQTGAFGYLAGYLDGTAGLPYLAAFEIHSANTDAVRVLGDQYTPMQIDALHVPHGIVPSLAFRVRIGSEYIVFGSDQNGSNSKFIEFAKNASILVMHLPIPEGTKGAGRILHAPPSVVGRIAASANAKTLVLSHLMARSLLHLDKNVKHVRSAYDGNIRIATDLECFLINTKESARGAN
jgi:ribonuclease BN (tRNA processing enzyme)